MTDFRLLLRRLAGAASLSALQAAAAAAPPAPEAAAVAAAVQPRAGVSAVELFALAEAARAEGRTADAETIYQALTNDPDLEVRTEARFRFAQMLVAGGDHRRAATLLRALLDEKPNAPRARIELAAVLARLGDEGGARRQLRQAQAGELPADVAAAVNQFAGALRARQPYGGSLSFAVVPDSNINRATDAQTLDTIIAPLDLSEDARAQSGIGMRLGAQAYARIPLGARIMLTPRLSTDAELYRQSEFNDISASAVIGLDIAGARDRLRPSIAQSVRYFGGDPYAVTRSAALGWLRAVGTRAQFEATATVARADYRRNDLQDGWLYDFAASYERAFDPRSGGRVSMSASRHAARDRGYSTLSGGGALLYWHDVRRTTLFGSVGLRRLEADARLLLFPERRQEWLASLAVGGTFRQATVHGFAPLVRLTYERNASSVGIYDYRRTAVNFGVTRAF